MADAGGRPVLVDPTVLDRLAEELGDRPAARSVAHLYREHLPTRVTRLVAAREGGDAQDVMDALLSLRVSSATIGAVALADAATRLEVALAAGDEVQAGMALADVVDLAPPTAEVLAAPLGDPPGRPEDPAAGR